MNYANRLICLSNKTIATANDIRKFKGSVTNENDYQFSPTPLFYSGYKGIGAQMRNRANDLGIFKGSDPTPPSLNSTESRTCDNLLALIKPTLAMFVLAELTKRPLYD